MCHFDQSEKELLIKALKEIHQIARKRTGPFNMGLIKGISEIALNRIGEPSKTRLLTLKNK